MSLELLRNNQSLRKQNYLFMHYIKTEVSPFLKTFRFGRVIPHDYCSRKTINWHET